MRIAYLDCFSGMSGDMFLGALLDAGVSQKLLEDTVTALNIGARLEVSRVNRSGVSALKVDVYSHGEKDLPREVYWEQKASRQQHHHGHDHHEHQHDSKPIALREHNFSPSTAEPGTAVATPHAHEHSHQHGRGLNEIREIILRAPISERAKQQATAIFEALGAAEAKIHSTEIDKVHFHEVGAVDAMVDIVCAAVGAEALGAEEIVCSPLNVGGGTVNCAHGIFPVPAPATLELLKDAPVYSSGIEAELVTPTGAAIIKTLATRFGAFPQMKVGSVGYGAGTRDFSGYPNVVRLTVGESQPEFAAEGSRDTIAVLEANLDDLSPQIFGYVMDRLLHEGALDVLGTAVQMKKGRPGMLLTVLCRPADASTLTKLIFAETTTLGVRRRDEQRHVLPRKWVNVITRWGDVRMKIASVNGTISNYAPEYEDCRRIAAEHQVPLKNVIEAAMQAYVQGRDLKEE